MAAEDADESNVRPDRIVGSFVDADESIVPLLNVIGKVVVAVAGLEKAMQLELTRLMCEDHGNKLETATGTLGAELDSLSKLPGGELLRRLKDRSLTEDLASRIDDAIKRRNRLVHHLFEDAELAKAIVDGGDLDAVIGRFERLALDCAELCVELQLFAVPRLEALLGTTRGGMIDALRSIDCQLLENSRDRELVEMIQSLANVDELASALGVLEGVSPPTTE